LTRKQSTFYKLRLIKPRSIQITQDYSQTAYTRQTNRNTLIAFYKIEDGTHRRELAINNEGYVVKEASIDVSEEDVGERLTDYPITLLDSGEYMFVITNDIRYQETEYAITLQVFLTDWRFTEESVEEALDFDSVTESAESIIDFGSLVAA